MDCSVCSAPVVVEFGRAFEPTEPGYRYTARPAYFYDADDPTHRHVCNPRVLTERLSRLKMTTVPNTPPVMETPRRRVQQQQKPERYGGEL